ncbi:DUF3473 domain-containing protein [Geminicoccaceae bacterium 1502E]|nr:DUF3473 domain-containing protein [Geminicoccaceae bacterium 1502E]
MTRPEPGPPHALTIDVEDWFQVWALSRHVPRASWDSRERRVAANTHRLLDLLGETGARATFFTLGWVAGREPALVRRIVAEGHELASHGWDHRLVYEQGEQEFRADVRRTRLLLEDIGGTAVEGYRAASFSIGAASPWAHRVLREEGYRYSSSSHPVRNDHYGAGRVPREAHVVDGLPEIPVSTLRLMGKSLPFAGGGYFRLLPHVWSRWAFARTARKEAPVVFYLHPWEIDPDQPRLPGLKLKTRLRHYGGLASFLPRLRRLLEAARWDRLDRAHPALAAASS